jgi:hypothetical protein
MSPHGRCLPVDGPAFAPMGDYFDDAFVGASGDSPAEFGDDWREWE